MIKKNINSSNYTELRKLDIKTEGPAVLGQTIVNRLLKAKIEIDGKIETKTFKNLGQVIDYVKKDKLRYVRSLYRKHRREIVDYLDDIGVLEYLGIDNAQKERLCKIGWQTYYADDKLTV